MKKQRVEDKEEEEEEEEEEIDVTKLDDDVGICLGRKLMIKVSAYKGVSYVNIREYFKDGEGNMRPTKKGVTLKHDEWTKLKKLMDGIDERMVED